MLLRNIQPTNGFANVPLGWMHRLTSDQAPPPDPAAAERAQRFVVATWDEPPLSINIAPLIEDDESGAGIESLTGDSLAVPVKA